MKVKRRFWSLRGVTIKRRCAARLCALRAQRAAQRRFSGFPDLTRFCYHLFDFRVSEMAA
jgi:hypothetical protein